MMNMMHYQLMARYNQWMNQRLYLACQSLSDDQRKADLGAFFGSIHNTLNHLLFADYLWMARFENQPVAYRLGEEIFSDFLALSQAREQFDQHIIAFSQTLTTTWLKTEIHYRSGIDNIIRTLPAWALLTHMFNHQTHHRGQITTLLSQQGIDVGITDIPWMPEWIPASL
ncbi:DinB family protein [Methylophaga pinxianii]|uniref:DinB family protein n=1 Tax=Methylophaga pinxianii TaxID=2881052 RepID=UPI001CF4904A|nr:DinB family protein [Methylophaga pinxianii]MCB2427957.1 DinB family protein [Methylophaga pinxianii]UPH44447.1 DinB family protein [Methylophaga pinxianii]